MTREFAKLLGLLFHFEHKHKIGKDEWTADDHLLWRQRYSMVILEKIHMRLVALKKRPNIPSDNPMNAAVEHALKQWNEIPAIFSSPAYRLDNNEVERININTATTDNQLSCRS